MMPVSETEGAAAVVDWIRSRGQAVSGWRSRRLDEAGAERLVVECVLDAATDAIPGGGKSFVSKCYVDDTGAHAFAVMNAIDTALRTRAASALAVPAALYYDSGRRCVVQQRVAGMSFRRLVEDADRVRLFRLAGAALAELHDLPLEMGAEQNLDGHLRDLVRPHPAELAAVLPDHAVCIGALVAEMQGLERYWQDQIDPAPLHRDVHLRQMFFGEGRVWLIDWDLFARGDPVLDLGNFLMVLETRAGVWADACRDAFLAGYFERRPACLEKRIPLYMAFNYLRRASKHYRLGQGDWQQDVARMLARAERCLAAA